ncbi:MAG: radical SAM protein [Promethearchaeota archaeon]
MKKKIIESKEGTFYIKGRGMPKGCELCLKGAKVVLFLNGICQIPGHCSWYCPISEERKGKDSTYANEIKISNKEELLEEINKIDAKGMSITGGEPLYNSNLDKTLDYIKYVKMKKGKSFHVHLYTNGINFDDKIAKKLSKAGLDEIRFNPPKNKWSNIQYALNKGISVGAEVPVIPESHSIKELEDFIVYLDNIGAEFINLNEFEYCFPNSQHLKDKGFKLKEGTIASVENSFMTAIDMIKKIRSRVLVKIHFCSIIAKDYHQLKNRYYRRAKAIKLPYEKVTKEGLLIYAEIEGRSENIIILQDILVKKYNLPPDHMPIKNNKLLLPINITLNEKFISLLDRFNMDCRIVEIIPFRDESYFQITESTPIKVFMKELDDNRKFIIEDLE